MTNPRFKWGLRWSSPILAVLITAPLCADVKLPTIFGDHMVLQQDTVLPVWGIADPGEKVTVTVGTETASGSADSKGKWIVKLPAINATPASMTMTVTGKNRLTFSDVLVGEVWFASGQSNMAFNLARQDTAARDVPGANDPQLRFFHVAGTPVLYPSSKLECGKWELCTPAVANQMSAVGYFFGKELRGALNRPVGLIVSAWGGTVIESWTPLAAIEGDPYFNYDVARHAQAEADYPKLLIDFPARQKAWQVDMDAWNKNGGSAYTAALKTWNAAAEQAKTAGQPEPPNKPVPPPTPAPKQPAPPDGGGGTFGALYNGIVAPVVPYAIKGVIWYQGESNATNYRKYAKLFPALINGWRSAWGEGDFPFLFVQLPGWSQGIDWPEMREVQSQALSLPATAMVSIIDIGDPNNIHPAHKTEVGRRLSLAARHLAYGENLVASGPVYDSMTVENNAIRISFTQTGGGLIIGSAPWIAPRITPIPADKLLGFTVADDQKHWFAADAKIDGSTVLVSSDKVTKPAAVRYAWANAPICNLYNKEGLPAAPFRTDSWPDTTPATTAPNPNVPSPSL